MVLNFLNIHLIYFTSLRVQDKAYITGYGVTSTLFYLS